MVHSELATTQQDATNSSYPLLSLKINITKHFQTFCADSWNSSEKCACIKSLASSEKFIIICFVTVYMIFLNFKSTLPEIFCGCILHHQ